MRKEFLIDCHCEECNDEAIHIPKWIAALPLVARNDGKRAAFTLAEVLITLTIIGVIAAITIPNLMQSYKKHEVEVRLKEAYNIITNAMTMSKTENGTFDDMLETAKGSAVFFAQNYIEPYIKYTEYCPPNNTTCRAFLTSTRNSLKRFNGDTASYGNYMYISWPRYVLQNGMYLGVAANGASQISFWVDIDGNKGKNQIGYDIFAFSLFKALSGANCSPDPSNAWCNKGNKIFPGFSNGLERTLLPQNTTCSGAGDGCAGLIMYNGWKIPDNYPVKKW